MSSAESRKAYFRQSTWMMTATVVSGGCMFLVHPLLRRITTAEYATFTTMLQLLVWLSIPAVGLQMVFAQLASAAVTEQKQRELSGAVRAVLAGTSVIWLLIAGVVLVLGQRLANLWSLDNVWPLWLTLGMGLLSLWAPLLNGLLQGGQNFKWIGWKEIINGAGRLLATFVLVYHLSATAIGGLSAALLALVASLAILAWQSRAVWLGAPAKFDWSDWGRRLVGLTLGFGAFLFMMSADAVILRAHFTDDQIGPYNGAGTLARAIVTFTAPLAAVMFPKIVHSLVHSQRTDAHKLTLIGAGVLAILAAIGLSLLAPMVLQFGFRPSFVSSAPLLPWYAWAMVPLALSNVLISDLMARSRFVASPWLALVAVAYGVTLAFHHKSFEQVILILGCFNTLLLAVAAAFTWQRRIAAS